MGAGLLFGCAAGTVATPPPPTDEVELRSPETLSEDFSWRQRVTAVHRAREPRSFDAVLEKKGSRLSLVGLTPIQTVLFVVVLEGETVSFENRTGEALPFPPAYILLDIQRVFYPWVRPADPSPSGTFEADFGEERVIETWSEGRLRERRFERADTPGHIRVRFEESGGAADAPPARVVLENDRQHYVLTIETAP